MKPIILSLMAVLLFTCNAGAENQVLDSPLAGKWYPAAPDKLRAMIAEFMKKAGERQLQTPIAALILPHAGYEYSGAVAACGIREVVGKKYSRIILIGPSHRGFPESDVVAIPSYSHIQTPLGSVLVDLKTVAVLRKCPVVRDYTPLHRDEHSVQIELPFLQFALRNFQIVPILVGALSEESAGTLAAALREVADADTLVVVSSDFTHYGANYRYIPFPLNSQTEKELNALDRQAFSFILKKDFTGFSEFVDRTGITICGQDAIRVLLAMLPSSSQATLLQYDTSGRMIHNFESSVSYAAFAFSGVWTPPAGKTPVVFRLTESERKNLLEMARLSLEWQLRNGDFPTEKQLGFVLTPGLEQDRAVFVTIHKNGALRGCIGEIYPRRPLYMAVISQAVNAGTNDPRFPQVTLDELPSIDFEISVLTPPRSVSGWRDIVIGRDGIILSKGSRSAVFLPQVAPEQQWNLETTLDHLSVKAGLEPQAWKSGCHFQVFQAEVFGERSLGLRK